MLVVGFRGYKRSGKNFSADILREEFPSAVETLAFAGPLKEVVRDLFLRPYGVPQDWLEGCAEREQDLAAWGLPGWSVRRLLQVAGTDWLRSVDPDYHVRQVEPAIEAARARGVKVLCFTDLRFANEADLVRAHDGLVVHVRRPQVEPGHGESPLRRLLHLLRRDRHASENQRVRCDHVVLNDDGRRMLRRRLLHVLGPRLEAEGLPPDHTWRR